MANEPANGFPFDHHAHEIHIMDVGFGYNGDPATPVRHALNEPTEGYLCQGRTQGLTAHSEPIGKLDFSKLLARL
jgi:hypothetical protein